MTTSTRRLIAFVVGIVLIVAAFVAVGTQQKALHAALGSLTAAPWWMVVLLVVLPLGNLVTVSSGFAVLTNRYGRVGWSEMLALIASAWLLNYLPMRAGMVGRFAYHKKVNGIAIRDCVRVLFISMGLSGLVIVEMLVITLLAIDGASLWAWTIAALAPPIACMVASGVVRAAGGEAWRLLLALGFRHIDMLFWVGRYVVVFSLVGRTLTPLEAVAIATVSQIAMLVPFLGNGLGLREWVVGLTASAVPALFGEGGEGFDAVGVAADLVNRGAEVLVAVPLGLLATAILGKRLAAAKRDEQPIVQ